MVVNSGFEERQVNINLKSKLGCDLHRHLYDTNSIEPDESATIIGIDKSFENVQEGFVDILPAQSMAIYTTRRD